MSNPGQAILSIGGAVVGAAFGQPMLGYAAGASLGAALFPTQGTTQYQTQPLIDLKIPGTEYGQPILWFRGHLITAGQYWWNTDRRAHTTTTSSTAGGKGGPPEQTTITETTTYDMDVWIGLSDCEIAAVIRVWDQRDGLIWTCDSEATAGSIAASAATPHWARMTVYTGAADQLPDPTYEAAVGTANAVAHRGRGSVFLEGLNLGASGELRQLLFEVATKATPVMDAATWNANDKTRGVALSAADATVTFSFAGAMVRTVAKSMTAGKFFQAFTVTTVSASLVFGFVKDIAPLTVATGNTYLGSAGLVQLQNGDLDSNHTGDITVIETGMAGWSNGDTGAIALDLVNGKGWLRKNGTWLNSGDPAAGTNPQWTGLSTTLHYGLMARGTAGALTLTSDTPPSGFIQLMVSAPADFVRFVRIKNVVKEEQDDSFSASEIRLLSGVTNITPAGAQCSYYAPNSYPAGGDIDPTLLLTDGILSSEASWATGSPTDNADWVIKFALAHDSGITPDGIKFARAKYGTRRVATDLDVEGSYDDITYFTMAALVDIANVATQTYSTVYALDPGTPPAPAAGLQQYILHDEDLADVQRDVFLRSGLTADQFDVTGLSAITRQVRGIPWSQVSAGRAITEILMGAYFYDLVLSGAKIVCVPRGGAALASIPFLDTGAHFGDEEAEPFALKTTNNLEMPSAIAVTYINIDDDYQLDTQTSDPWSSAVQGTIEAVNLSLVLTPSEAKAIANTWMRDRLVARTSTTVALLGDYCALEATDPVTVTGPDGLEHRLRLVEKTDSFPLQKFKAVLDDISVLSDSGTTSSDYTPSTSVSGAVDTLLELLDIPILRDADNDAGLYVTTKGDGTPYPGSGIYSSPDDVTYAAETTVNESGIFGTCTTTLGDWTGGNVFDEVNSVTVNVGAGTLASSTRDAVLGSQSVNAMLLGAELLQFRTATLVSAGVYTLSGLLRGKRGTEWAMLDHVASERCVLLRASGLRRIARLSSDIGVSLYYKGVTLGRALSTATGEMFTDNAVGLKPFSPVDLRAAADSSGARTITWSRRTRMGTRFLGPLSSSVPLGEDSERYDVELFDDVDALVSTTTVTSPQVTIGSYTTEFVLAMYSRWVREVSGYYAGVFQADSGYSAPNSSIRVFNLDGTYVGGCYLGKMSVAFINNGADLYAAVHNLGAGSTIVRVGMLTTMAIEATYTSGVGDIQGAAFDGTNVFIAESYAGTLRKLNATTLASVASYSINAGLGAMFYLSGSLWICDRGNSQIIEWNIAGAVEAQRIDCVSWPYGVRVAGGFVYVAGSTAFGIYDASTGAQIASYSNGFVGDLWQQAFVETTDYVVAVNGAAHSLLFFDKTRGALAQNIGIDSLVALAGGDGETIFVVKQPPPAAVYPGGPIAEGFPGTFALSALGDLTGYTAAIHQLSATVGRGYPASIGL